MQLAPHPNIAQAEISVLRTADLEAMSDVELAAKHRELADALHDRDALILAWSYGDVLTEIVARKMAAPPAAKHETWYTPTAAAIERFVDPSGLLGAVRAGREGTL